MSTVKSWSVGNCFYSLIRRRVGPKAASIEWKMGIEGDHSGKYNAWALQRHRGDWEQREGGGERDIEEKKSGWSGCRYCTYYLLTQQADGSVHWHLCSWLDVADRTSTTDNNEARHVFGFQNRAFEN